MRAGVGGGPCETPRVRIVVCAEAEVPHDLRMQVVALQHQAWPSDSALDPAPWHDPAEDPLSVLLLDDDERVVSALDILSKEIVHGGASYRASGISAMVTGVAVRGRGFGRRLAGVARETMRVSGADLGIFTCDTPLRELYASAGWEHLPETVLVGGTREDPFPSDRFDKVTMACFFSQKAKAAREGFIGARVELFSGSIDRLW